MNLLHLKYAVEVERTGSITQAADNLYMGQPNLSKAIKDLENSLGISIFKRSTKGVVPTEKGKGFLECAKKVLSEIDEMEKMYKDEEDPGLELKISAAHSVYIMLAFTNFVDNFSDEERFNIKFQEANALDTIHSIVDLKYNFGIIRFAVEYEKYYLDLLVEKGLKMKTLTEFDTKILLSQNDPLADKEIIEESDLENYTEIIFEDYTYPYLIEQKLRPKEKKGRRKKIHIYERGGQMYIIKSHKNIFSQASPIPRMILNANGLVQKKCAKLCNTYKDVIVYPESYIFSELDLKFIDELTQILNEEIDW